MCIAAWHWDPLEGKLLLVSNRDEWYHRPTRSAHWWNDAPILAGRDLQAGGTWLGINAQGRLGLLTNYRQATNEPSIRPSRGSLIVDFLLSDADPENYLQSVARRADDFEPFNLLVCDGYRLMGLESRASRVFDLQTGIGSVSNADFDSAWPKQRRLEEGLRDFCQTPSTDLNQLFQLLQDAQRAALAELPTTGIGQERELALSSIFIRTPDYGTRCSSVVCLERSGIRLLERTHDMANPAQQEYFIPSNPSKEPAQGSLQRPVQRASGSSILTSRTSRLS